jgi:hypothetical protein
MSFGALKAVIPSSIPGKAGVDMRRIPPMAVEEAVKYGTKKITADKFGNKGIEYSLGDLKVYTDEVDSSIIVSLRVET